jgi:shikimate dehydrogenase
MVGPVVIRGGLIGAHISKTRLPAALAMLCADCGLGLEFELIDTAENPVFDLSAQIERCRHDGWDGVSVTHPHKIGAFEWLKDEITGDLKELGSANMIAFKSGVCGSNTDFTGFLSAWRAEMGKDRPGRVVIAGAGGVARALGPALLRLGASDIAIFDVSGDRARQLAQTIGPSARALTEAELATAIAEANGLVNATPIGMAEHPGSPFPCPLDVEPDWVFDAIYTPTETRFIKEARRTGAEVITGFSLFKHMALRTFEAYTGREMNADRILPRLDELKPS